MTDKRPLREGSPDGPAIAACYGDEGTASTPEPLIVYLDDSKETLEEVQEAYEFNDLKCATFTDPSEALRFCAKQDRILFLIDLNLDGLNGLEVVDELQQNRREAQQIDCVVISGSTAFADAKAAISRGAVDYINKPVDIDQLLSTTRKILASQDAILEQRARTQAIAQGFSTQLKELEERVDIAYRDALSLVTGAAEHKDPETGEHLQRLSLYAERLCEEMGLSSDETLLIKLAAPLHDVGKVGIPDAIMRKEGPLDANEWEVMKTHTTIGGEILSGSTHPVVAKAAEVAIGHHEKWDGSGYPDGKQRKDVPLSARIIAIADVYDALRSKRPYKEAWSHEKAVSIIVEGDGRTMPEHFDPDVLAAFKRCATDLGSLFESNPDQLD